jgi:hypothetical protein
MGEESTRQMYQILLVAVKRLLMPFIPDSGFQIPDSGITAFFDLYPEILIQKSQVRINNIWNQRHLESGIWNLEFRT